MAKVQDSVLKVRSKNAGPFWLTIDIFCGSPEAYNKLMPKLSTEHIAALFKESPTRIKRFDIESIYSIKFSLPRPSIQGERFDRDMHGAQWAVLVAELEL